MVYLIHKMSHSTQQQAKQALMSQMAGRGYSFTEIPYLTGVGIGENKIVVVVQREHPDHYYIPSELGGEFEGLPVELELGGLFYLQGPGGGGGGRCPGSGLQGGARVSSRESGTCTGVFNGVRDKNMKYAVV
jgi:hypothetical protein